ncbi:MAG: outer membrane lipoprotein carrier protein LolA [bacterium]|nr:outer membrane lipoprotein carrier protein LolA [bacterium]
MRVFLLLLSWGLAAAAGLATGAGALSADSSTGTDPWQVLAGVRDQLRDASPLETRFIQTFVPGGFSTGDTESGALYVDLPRCLRFEYLEPFPKDFLLCGDWVYTWNPGESSGRRFLVNDSEAEGLDLLRLEVDALRARYRAELGAPENDRTIIRLIPKNETSDLREATIEVGHGEAGDPSADHSGAARLLALAYDDASGNQTRFEMTNYEELEDKTDFAPPAIDWLED